MTKTVVVTGASGNMGRETVRQLLESDCDITVRALMINKRKERALAKKWKKLYKNRIETVFGDIAERDVCENIIKDSAYVLNLAAVIPPTSDHKYIEADRCNRIGAKNVVEAIEESFNQPKLIHISTVAVYGNRNYLHPWGRVGDPLLPSVYDCYAAGKVKGERAVLESNIKTWAVLRQTAMLHSRMLTDNMKDGLMFHTTYNVPLEWVTARDSGRLMTKIIEKDLKGEADDFWYKCYNIGGGARNRCTGYDTFDGGFRIIGGSTEKFMNPSWNTIRNFHGLWFFDSDVLEKMFHYQTEDINDYWQEILAKHRYYTVAKIIPYKWISKIAIQRLLTDENAPRKWIDSDDNGKVNAYFGSKENVKCMPTSWKEYPVLAKGQLADGSIDYEALRDIANADKYLLKHGYDESKADEELDLNDMKQAAAFRGGKCLSESMVKGDLYTPLLWECHDGHKFYAKPYTIIKAGHWCPICSEPEPWDYDRLAKDNPFFAQIWYDTHAKKENIKYYFDNNHVARFIRQTEVER